MNIVGSNAYSRHSARDLSHSSSIGLLVFFSAHVPLALLMNQVREVGTLHALLTLGAGLWYALLGRDVVKVALVGAYITGAEVLWRMVDAGVIWEFGKYATIATFAIGIVRLHGLKGTKLPLVYFLVMLPSGILTLSELGLDDARDQVSFNLSGPLALMVCAWFFSQVRLSTEQLQRLFLVAIGPIVGIATIALYSTFTAVSIRWSDESNFVTSGGFGPNQVSNALGLGALLAFVFIRQGKVSRFLQALMFAAVLVFGTLSALTFSRSGLYNAGAAAAVLLLFSIRDRAALVRVGLSLVALFLLVDNFILPNLQEFTGGAILTRFQDTGLTHRQEIAEADLQVWMHNPLFGVGPGMAKEARALFLDPVAAHTEVTRLLAEHGFFGLIAFLLLLVMSYQNYRRAQGTAQKGFVAAMVVWTMLFMLNSAMRLVAPALIFGLTFGYLPADDGVNHAQTSAGLATALV